MNLTTQKVGKGRRVVEVVSAETTTDSKALIIPPDSTIQPEDDAMLQAFYSRSHPGIIENLERALSDDSDSGKFFDKYYVGYGHKSIGDCGSTTVYIEDVSMLVAKAVQNCQLYNGQEKSTRYIDFGSVPFFNPFHYNGTRYPEEAAAGDRILEGWRKLYMYMLPAVLAHVRRQYPWEDNTGTKRSVYDNATKARAFDICRGLLPAGARTSLSWHGELSTFGDQLPKLKTHPLAEVRDVARAIEEVLVHVFPHSFPVKDHDRLERRYDQWGIGETYHHDPDSPEYRAIERLDHSAFPEPIRMAPGEMLLPDRYKHGGTIEIQCRLDFGSFRDIARHRAVFQSLPLLTTDHGMHSWYLENMGAIEGASGIGEMIEEMNDFLPDNTPFKHSETALRAQYFIPMGYGVSCKLTGHLWALAYLARLRCSSKVHPTLADLALRIRDTLAPFVNVVLTENPLRFNLKRGRDTIVKK